MTTSCQQQLGTFPSVTDTDEDSRMDPDYQKLTFDRNEQHDLDIEEVLYVPPMCQNDLSRLFAHVVPRVATKKN